MTGAFDDDADRPSGPALQPVDWDALERPRLLSSPRSRGFLATVALLVAAWARDYFLLDRFHPFIGDTPLGRVGWNPRALDWLFVLSVLVFVFYVVVPVARNRERVERYWHEFAESRLAVAGLAYLVVYFLVGTLGPIVLGTPTLDVQHAFQPPVFGGVTDEYVTGCYGPVTDGICHGTWRHPLGSTRGGKDVLKFVVAGARVSLMLALVTSMLMIPIATAVGTVAAYYGGRVDGLLMRYVDLQQTVPAIVVYLILLFVYGPTLALLIVVFGLFNWGGVARVVRSQALQEREAAYVRAAESAGAGPFHVIRRHLVPNVSNAVVTTLTLQIPLLIIAEAALAFLDYGDGSYLSWGQVIRFGVSDFWNAWWITIFPALALVLTVLSFNVVGDALRDALDPQTEG